MISQNAYISTKDGQSFNENLHFNFDVSKNLFVSIYDNKENQYLFSINSYNSMLGLYDVNNKDNL